MARWPRVRLQHVRSGLLFTGGFLGLVHETIVSQADRPYLIGAFTLMLGLPLAVGTDQRRQRSRTAPPEPEPGDSDGDPP